MAAGAMIVYRLLLRAFPASFRDRFGRDMADVFADRARLHSSPHRRATSIRLALGARLTPHDPATLGGVVLLLGAAATLASWIPTRRSSRVDPVMVLRAD